jgi:GLPGLI family protein
MNKILNIDFDRQLIYAIALTKGKDIIYSNLKSRTILRKVSTLGEEFNIKSSMDSIKWELTQEQKKIGEFICYKAYANSTFKNKIKIEAWYSPVIQQSFGPKGYGGLPGLILELTENRITYIATNVKLNINEPFVLDFKDIDKYISQKELDSIISTSVKRNRLN